MPGKGLLLVMTDIDPAVEEQFNAWYDEEHVPQLLAVPGFLSGRRYRILDGQPKYLAIYDVENLSVLEQPEYLRVRPWDAAATRRSREIFPSFRNTVRGIYQHLATLPTPEPTDVSAARGLLLVGLEVDAAHDEEFNAWYSTEHLPALAGTPGVVRARRFKVSTQVSTLIGDPTAYVALYELERPEVQASAEWQRRANTPWGSRIRRFFTRRVRNLYERILPV